MGDLKLWKFGFTKEKQDKILADQKAKAKTEREEQEERLFAQKIQADAERKLIADKAKKEKDKQDKIIADKEKEHEKTEARLKEQVECPFCHRKFVPERKE